jgi:hypothetical protein
LQLVDLVVLAEAIITRLSCLFVEVLLLAGGRIHIFLLFLQIIDLSKDLLGLFNWLFHGFLQFGIDSVQVDSVGLVQADITVAHEHDLQWCFKVVRQHHDQALLGQAVQSHTL